MYEEANKTQPDGSTQLVRYLNSGNYFLRRNERTQRLMKVWMDGYAIQGADHGNQMWLNWMAGFDDASYGICHTRAQCAAVKAAGRAAIKPHPNQFARRGQMCMVPAQMRKDDPELCDDRRLYVHAVCRCAPRGASMRWAVLGFRV